MKLNPEHSKYLFHILIIGFIFLLIYSILIYVSDVSAKADKKDVEVLVNSNQIPLSEKLNTAKQIQKENLDAKAFIIYDINSKKIVRSDNAHSPLPIASLTKIITVGTFLDTAKKTNMALREETKNIIKRALVQSSNEDADTLGYVYSYSFGKNLLQDSNQLINNLNISDTRITNLTGLDNYDGTASNVGSAESLAKIFAFMYENYRDVFEFTKFEELETDYGTIKNTNQTTNNTFGIMVSKTGFTWEAGGNLGVVVSPEPGSSYVVLVMGSTKEGRFKDINKLVTLLPIILKE